MPLLAWWWEERRLRAFLVAPRAQSAWPPLPSPSLTSPPIRPRAPTCGRFQKMEKGGSRGSWCSTQGGHFSSWPCGPKNLGWMTRPERSRPILGSARPALQPQPRVCSLWHLAPGAVPLGERPGWRSRGPLPLDAFSSLNSLAWVIPTHGRIRTCLLGSIWPRLRGDSLQLNIACVEDMPYLGRG